MDSISHDNDLMQNKPQDVTTTGTKSIVDEYMEKFDEISKNNKAIENAVNSIMQQSNDQCRLYKAINCIKMLQKHNEDLLDLLILMNNFFGSK